MTSKCFLVGVCLLILLRITLPCWAESGKMHSLKTEATADEKSLLKALERLRESSFVGADFQRYSELVVDAAGELNILKRSKNKNELFFFYAHASYGAYHNAKLLWESKLRFGNEAARDEAIQFNWKRASENLNKAYEFIE